MSQLVPEPPEQVLIVKPSSLGDIVHSLPVAAALHAQWPGAKISWLVRPEFAPILEQNPAVQETIPFPRTAFRGLPGFVRGAAWAAGLRKIQADLTLDLQGLLRSGLFSSIATRGTVVGLDDAREGARAFYRSRAPIDPMAHSVDRYLSVLEILGIEAPETPAFPMPSGERPACELPPNFILLHPYARGAAKSLDPDLIENLTRESVVPIVLAGRTDVTPPRLGQNVINLLNLTTIAELIWLLRHADAVISVDSGPMHMASALSHRLLSIHTWTDPLSVGPYNPEASVWKNGELLPVHALEDRHRAPGRAPVASDLPDFFAWLKH